MTNTIHILNLDEQGSKMRTVPSHNWMDNQRWIKGPPQRLCKAEYGTQVLTDVMADLPVLSAVLERLEVDVHRRLVPSQEKAERNSSGAWVFDSVAAKTQWRALSCTRAQETMCFFGHVLGGWKSEESKRWLRGEKKVQTKNSIANRTSVAIGCGDAQMTVTNLNFAFIGACSRVPRSKNSEIAQPPDRKRKHIFPFQWNRHRISIQKCGKKKKVRVGTWQYFKWIESLTT